MDLYSFGEKVGIAGRGLVALVLLVFLGVFLFAALPSCSPEEEAEQEVAEEEVEEEPTLSSDEVDEVADNLEGTLDDESDFLAGEGYDMHILELNSIEFAAEDNQLNIVIDYQAESPEGDILPSSELKEVNETIAWVAAEATEGVSNKDYNVRVRAQTSANGDVLDWGSTRYTYDDGDYTFREGAAFDMMQ